MATDHTAQTPQVRLREIRNRIHDLADELGVGECRDEALAIKDEIENLRESLGVRQSEAPPPADQLRHAASAMKKLLPPMLMAEVLSYLDPLGTFESALTGASEAPPTQEEQK